MPKFTMLIGVPASGKSTWREANAGDAVIISSDDIIDQTAAAQGRTYNEVFKENIKFATQLVEERAKAAFADGKDVVWDQTNLTPKSRKPKLSLVPEYYEKIAVYFPTPEEGEWRRRLDSREVKNIPENILMGMNSSLTTPDETEGFDTVIIND